MNKKFEDLITLDMDYILTGSEDEKEQNRIFCLNLVFWVSSIILFTYGV